MSENLIVVGIEFLFWFIFILITIAVTFYKYNYGRAYLYLAKWPPTKRTNPYIVTLVTGHRMGSGTEGLVYLRLKGENGSSSLNRIKGGEVVKGKKVLSIGNQDSFLIIEDDLGKIEQITISLHSEKKENWFLSYIKVDDIMTERQYYLPCHRWMESDEEGGQEIDLLVQYGMTHVQFFDNLLRGFKEFYIWTCHWTSHVFAYPIDACFNLCTSYLVFSLLAYTTLAYLPAEASTFDLIVLSMFALWLTTTIGMVVQLVYRWLVIKSRSPLASYEVVVAPPVVSTDVVEKKSTKKKFADFSNSNFSNLVPDDSGTISPTSFLFEDLVDDRTDDGVNDPTENENVNAKYYPDMGLSENSHVSKAIEQDCENREVCVKLNADENKNKSLSSNKEDSEKLSHVIINAKKSGFDQQLKVNLDAKVEERVQQFTDEIIRRNIATRKNESTQLCKDEFIQVDIKQDFAQQFEVESIKNNICKQNTIGGGINEDKYKDQSIQVDELSYNQIIASNHEQFLDDSIKKDIFDGYNSSQNKDKCINCIEKLIKMKEKLKRHNIEENYQKNLEETSILNVIQIENDNAITDDDNNIEHFDRSTQVEENHSTYSNTENESKNKPKKVSKFKTFIKFFRNKSPIIYKKSYETDSIENSNTNNNNNNNELDSQDLFYNFNNNNHFNNSNVNNSFTDRNRSSLFNTFNDNSNAKTNVLRLSSIPFCVIEKPTANFKLRQECNNNCAKKIVNNVALPSPTFRPLTSNSTPLKENLPLPTTRSHRSFVLRNEEDLEREYGGESVKLQVTQAPRIVAVGKLSNGWQSLPTNSGGGATFKIEKSANLNASKNKIHENNSRVFIMKDEEQFLQRNSKLHFFNNTKNCFVDNRNNNNDIKNQSSRLNIDEDSGMNILKDIIFNKYTKDFNKMYKKDLLKPNFKLTTSNNKENYLSSNRNNNNQQQYDDADQIKPIKLNSVVTIKRKPKKQESANLTDNNNQTSLKKQEKIRQEYSTSQKNNCDLDKTIYTSKAFKRTVDNIVEKLVQELDKTCNNAKVTHEPRKLSPKSSIHFKKNINHPITPNEKSKQNSSPKRVQNNADKIKPTSTENKPKASYQPETCKRRIDIAKLSEEYKAMTKLRQNSSFVSLNQCFLPNDDFRGDRKIESKNSRPHSARSTLADSLQEEIVGSSDQESSRDLDEMSINKAMQMLYENIREKLAKELASVKTTASFSSEAADILFGETDKEIQKDILPCITTHIKKLIEKDGINCRNIDAEANIFSYAGRYIETIITHVILRVQKDSLQHCQQMSQKITGSYKNKDTYDRDQFIPNKNSYININCNNANSVQSSIGSVNDFDDSNEDSIEYLTTMNEDNDSTGCLNLHDEYFFDEEYNINNNNNNDNENEITNNISYFRTMNLNNSPEADVESGQLIDEDFTILNISTKLNEIEQNVFLLTNKYDEILNLLEDKIMIKNHINNKHSYIKKNDNSNNNNNLLKDVNISIENYPGNLQNNASSFSGKMDEKYLSHEPGFTIIVGIFAEFHRNVYTHHVCDRCSSELAENLVNSCLSLFTLRAMVDIACRLATQYTQSILANSSKYFGRSSKSLEFKVIRFITTKMSAWLVEYRNKSVLELGVLEKNDLQIIHPKIAMAEKELKIKFFDYLGNDVREIMNIMELTNCGSEPLICNNCNNANNNSTVVNKILNLKEPTIVHLMTLYPRPPNRLAKICRILTWVLFGIVICCCLPLHTIIITSGTTLPKNEVSFFEVTKILSNAFLQTLIYKTLFY